MTPKILSQTGISLADVYDVEGSIAGVESLEARDVSLVHDMGSTIFSERMSAIVRRVDQAGQAQNIDFSMTILDLPAGVWRVLGVAVLCDTAARTAFVQVSLRDPLGGREIPIFVWDTANDVQSQVRIVDDGAATGNIVYFNSRLPFVPTLAVGTEQPQRVGQEIVCRGRTAGFGAGTVAHICIVHIGFAQIAGISSIGLPIPSW